MLLLDTGTPVTSREIYSEDAVYRTRTRNPSFIYKQSALAIQLNNLIAAIAGKELRLSSWCIASLYIYHFSTVVDCSSEKYSGSTGHRNSWKFTVRMPMMGLELAPLGYKPRALAIELNSSIAIAGKELSLSSWCIASLYIYLSFLNCG